MDNYFNEINRRDLSNFDIEKTPFLFFQAHNDDFNQQANKVPFTNTISSQLSKMYFSEKNIHVIQKMLIKYIFENSNGKYLIQKQNQDSLLGHMQKNFVMKSLNKPDNLEYQVKRLNWLTVDEIGPIVLSNVLQHQGYLRDKFSPITPIDRPLYESSAGTRTIPSFY